MPVTKKKLKKNLTIILKLAACFKAAQYLPAATQLGSCFTNRILTAKAIF